MPNDRHALDFDLKELIIHTIKGNDIDISYLIDEINIYEDIFNNSLSMDIVIDDATNQVNQMPITGHESITIIFRTPGQPYITSNFRTYKIDSREL